jgi:leucyl-tRNA synthetase
MTASVPEDTPGPPEGFVEPAGYDPGAVERKWRERWAARAANRTDLAGAARPFYALMMFPYPSAEGLHVGNLFAFTE